LSAMVGFQMDPWKLGAISLVGSSLCLASFINIQVPKFSLLLSAKGKKNTPR
jgi:hypothetical protein